MYMGAEASAPTVEAARSGRPAVSGTCLARREAPPHAPAAPRRTTDADARPCQLGALWHAPALPGSLVDRPPTCRQEGFAVAGFQRGGDLPADAHQPDVWRAMRTLDSARPPPSPSLAPWRREGVSPSHGLP